MKVTDYIANFLAEQGVTVVFGYQGSSIAHMIDSIYRHNKLVFVENRNEQASAFAAVGYSISKKELGVAVACSGPGAINLINGIADAYYDSVPCLFITGQVSQKEMKKNPELRQFGFQETAIIDIVKPITKYAVTVVSPSKIPDILYEAVKYAYEGRPGPVVIDIPHNIQGAQIENTIPKKVIKDEHYCSCNDNRLIYILDKLQNAKRPVFLIGGGCDSFSFDVQKKLSNHSIPVVTSYRGKNNYDNTLSNYCGVAGVYGDRCANWSLKYSDLIICLGSRLDGRQTAGEPLQKGNRINVIAVDIDKYELSKLPNDYIKVHANANILIKLLLDRLNLDLCFDNWLKTVSDWRKRYPIEKEYQRKEGVNPNVLLKKISKFFSKDCAVAVDVGQNQLWTNISVDIKYTQSIIQSCGLGAMGFALPAAIGAYYTGRSQVICISGDGGIQMNIQELQTVKEYGIPLKIIILNNKCLGLIRDYQSKALESRYTGSVIGFGSPDYKLLADAYGFEYLLIHSTTEQQLEYIKTFFNSDSPCLIEVKLSKLSTACPEPSYGLSIVEQSWRLPETELLRIEEEAYECK